MQNLSHGPKPLAVAQCKNVCGDEYLLALFTPSRFICWGITLFLCFVFSFKCSYLGHRFHNSAPTFILSAFVPISIIAPTFILSAIGPNLEPVSICIAIIFQPFGALYSHNSFHQPVTFVPVNILSDEEISIPCVILRFSTW